jgi:HEAT repeat protein
MSTRTSLATPLRPASPALSDALAAIGQGDLSRSALTALSDLDRLDGRHVMRAWRAWPVEVRRRLVTALEELAEEQVALTFARVLRIALDDSDASVRAAAIAALWEDESSLLLDRLLELLDDPSRQVRAEAARGLGRFAERAAAGDYDDERERTIFVALEARAADLRDDAMVRRRALESVASFGSRGRVRALIEAAYEHDDVGVRAGAVCAMGRTLERRWVPVILDELEADEAELRYEAARAAGAIGDDDAVPGLALLATDRDAEVRFAAISALGTIGSTAATRALLRLLEDAAPADREAIEEALESGGDDLFG